MGCRWTPNLPSICSQRREPSCRLIRHTAWRWPPVCIASSNEASKWGRRRDGDTWRRTACLLRGPSPTVRPKISLNSLVFPNCMISLGIPFQHAEGRSTRRNPQARLAFAQRCLRALALGNVEVHAKNAI